MAPNGATLMGSYHNKRLAMDSLRRGLSDISIELAKEAKEVANSCAEPKLPPILELEDAKCECCGLREQCTPEFINRERDKFLGRLVCGICGEAVKEEMEKNGGKIEEALEEHMKVCAMFNKVERAYPVLYQAEVMREIYKKRSSISRAKSMSPKDRTGPKGTIARSSSCVPAISREAGDEKGWPTKQ